MNKLFLTSLAISAIGSANATTVFTTDFNSGVPAQISGVTTTAGVAGFSAYGFSGSLLQNDTLGSPTVLTLTGLAPHTTVDINFLLAVMDSWDGASTDSVSPDNFVVEIDGTPITQSFDLFNSGDQIILPGATTLAYNLALGFGGWNDAAYDMDPAGGLTVAHTSSSLTVKFYSSGGGFQGGVDESWGIDNLNVVIDSIPGLPEAGATLLLLAMSAAGIAGIRRRS